MQYFPMVVCLVVLSLSDSSFGQDVPTGNVLILEVHAMNYDDGELLRYAMALSPRNSVAIYKWGDDKYILYYARSFAGESLMENLPDIVVPVDFREGMNRKRFPPRVASGKAVYVQVKTMPAGRRRLREVIEMAQRHCIGVDVITFGENIAILQVPEVCDLSLAEWESDLLVIEVDQIEKIFEFIYGGEKEAEQREGSSDSRSE